MQIPHAKPHKQTCLRLDSRERVGIRKKTSLCVHGEVNSIIEKMYQTELKTKEPTDELLETIRLIATTLDGIKGGDS